MRLGPPDDGAPREPAPTSSSDPGRAPSAASPSEPPPPAERRPGPLAGLRVVDCSTVLAGPYCTMLLGDLGADVVKVEPPEGDATRGWGPPWVGSGAEGTRTAAYFLAVNRNKRGLRLDLRTEDGREVLRRLLVDADVLVENARVGGFARLGFDDETLAALNPGLVHLAISGYGPTGPAAQRPGYDFVIQAVAGLMSITGAPDEEGGGPTKVGVAISDVVTGMLGAIAVLAAVIGRAGRAERDGGATEHRAATEHGGATAPSGATEYRAATAPGGQRVDVSLLGSTLASLVNQAQNAFVTGVAPVRLGNAHPNIVPYETFETADGSIAVAVGSERQWPRLCAALDLAELAADPRFATNGDRVEHRAELRSRLAARFRERANADWLTILTGADIPCGPINDIVAAFDSAEAEALGMTVTQEHPAWGVIRQVGIPFALSATPAAIRTPPPVLGEHTAEILASLGYDGDAIEDLRARGVT
jgi:crotonobetainyl-CoA:carnitine CoA-transferase CaiB-like acyl-CoA transferase